jgi:hypothetical protein
MHEGKFKKAVENNFWIAFVGAPKKQGPIAGHV